VAALRGTRPRAAGCSHARARHGIRVAR
jgi:hypothetical protein